MKSRWVKAVDGLDPWCEGAVKSDGIWRPLQRCVSCRFVTAYVEEEMYALPLERGVVLPAEAEC